MADKLDQTVQTYNSGASDYAAYFRSVTNSRKDDIELAFKEFETNTGNKSNSIKVLEIGCADGRDAEEILKLTSDYTGFDISEELIKIGRNNLPAAKLEVGDARRYSYPDNLDIVFAFASLLHLDKNEISWLLDELHNRLNPGGVIFVSLKYGESYKSYVKTDKHGDRLFYLYNLDEIKQLAGDKFEVKQTSKGFVTEGVIEWFEAVLIKR